MKHFSFDNVAFVRGNCLDRRSPVLLRACFSPDCKAAWAKLLYAFTYLSAEGVTILETDLQMCACICSFTYEDSDTPKQGITNLLLSSVTFPLSGGKNHLFTFTAYVKAVLAVPSRQCSQDRKYHSDTTSRGITWSVTFLHGPGCKLHCWRQQLGLIFGCH